MAMGGGIWRNSGTELKLYLGCTGSTIGGIRRNSGTELKLYLGCTGSTIFQKDIPVARHSNTYRPQLREGTVFIGICQSFC